jgi:phage/plasmid-associated DNA primase
MPDVSPVVNIADVPKKKKTERQAPTQDPTPKKPPMGDIYKALFDEIETKPEFAILSGFKMGAYELRHGVKQPYLETLGKECIPVGIEKVRQLILEYCVVSYPDNPWFSFTSKLAQGAAEYWYDRKVCAEKPATILEHGDERLCLRRLPFDIIENPGGKHTGAFNELFSRIKSNAAPLKAFVWSLFLPQSYAQQYVWLHGDGNDGKGSLTRALLKVMGQVGTVQNTAPWKGNKHWAIPFVDKRLVVFPDFKDGSSMDNGILKALTGGDPVYLDPKGTPGYISELICKIIFASNDMPNFGGSKADMRRIIFSRFEGTSKFDPNYESHLWQEMKYFLGDCRAAYYDLCGAHGPIPTDEESSQILAGDIEDKNGEFVNFFNRNLIEKKTSQLSPSQLNERLMDFHIKDGRHQGRFLAWLKDSKGYATKQDKPTGKRFIKGLELKPYPGGFR